MAESSIMRIDKRHAARIAEALREKNYTNIEAVATKTEYQCDLDLLRRLMEYAVKRFGKDDDALDQWLAPRIHYVVRVPRGVAGDIGIWTWLATGLFRPYIEHRWPTNFSSKLPWWRYNDAGILRNGVARLWWAAELVRNGPDYSVVPEALRAVRVFQNVGELRYSWHRETARAFTRVLTARNDLGDRLSPAVNAYLATFGLEYFDDGFEAEELTSWDPEWGRAEPTYAEATADVADLEGPNAGYSRRDVEDQMKQWIDAVFEQTQDEGAKAKAD